MSQKKIPLEFSITESQAQALANALDRLTHSRILDISADTDEANRISSGFYFFEQALHKAGFKPANPLLEKAS